MNRPDCIRKFIVASCSHISHAPGPQQAKVIGVAVKWRDTMQLMILAKLYPLWYQFTDVNKHWKCVPSILPRSPRPRFQWKLRKVNRLLMTWALALHEIFVDLHGKCLLVSDDSEHYHVHSLHVTVGLPFGLSVCQSNVQCAMCMRLQHVSASSIFFLLEMALQKATHKRILSNFIWFCNMTGTKTAVQVVQYTRQPLHPPCYYCYYLTDAID